MLFWLLTHLSKDVYHDILLFSFCCTVSHGGHYSVTQFIMLCFSVAAIGYSDVVHSLIFPQNLEKTLLSLNLRCWVKNVKGERYLSNKPTWGSGEHLQSDRTAAKISFMKIVEYILCLKFVTFCMWVILEMYCLIVSCLFVKVPLCMHLLLQYVYCLKRGLNLLCF